jgi:hypothetical protein
MSVAQTRRAGKRMALQYKKPRKPRSQVEEMGLKKGAKQSKRK